jgi:DNA repair protein RecO (recombination protein O)
MMTKTKGIVLHSLNYGDSQMIVDMFTEQLGRLSFICHISNSPKAKLKKMYFQPLHLLELEFDYRSSRNLQRIKDIRMSCNFTSIPFDSYKLAITLFLSEFLYHSTKDEQINLPLYQYIDMSVRWLDQSNRSFSNFHLVFMMRLSRFIGFFPNLDNYEDGDSFDLRNGCFSKSVAQHHDVLQPSEAAKIGLLMRMNYESMHLFRMNRAERNRCTDIILQYYRLHVPNFPELKSLSVMQELFV